jgi:hypothetical protein
VVIKNNTIDVLVLNWNGRHVKLVNNKITDLHVNQNVERTGDATSGRFVKNTISNVQQLRHFDGVFAHNTIGEPDSMNMFGTNRVVNFDGFNGARFHHNTIYGYMDATLHGHHHSSGFAKVSHYHGMPKVEKKHDHGDTPNRSVASEESEEPEHIRSGIHGHRYHKVFITHNKIYSLGDWALRYTDQNHSANDRTASSETDERLNGYHVHHTRVYVRGNKLYGSGIFVDVFNAEDDHHKKYVVGSMQLKRNTITLERSTTDFGQRWGILVQRALKMDLKIVKNNISAASDALDAATERRAQDSGIFMNELEGSRVAVQGNEVKDFVYGVRAANFTESTRWSVSGLKTLRVQYPVFYDNTVANHPRRTD